MRVCTFIICLMSVVSQFCNAGDWVRMPPTEISFSGEIKIDDFSKFLKVYKPTDKAVVLNSSGGRMDAALDIGSILIENKNLEMKLRAYAIYFAVCTGIRRGNLLGLLSDDLHPDAEVPHFFTRDNIVAGWSRGLKGDVTLENSSKTILGVVKLPLLMPSPETLVEVAQFLKKHIPPGERLLKCSTGTVDDWWARIAKECQFKFLTPHDWK